MRWDKKYLLTGHMGICTELADRAQWIKEYTILMQERWTIQFPYANICSPDR